MANKRQLKKNIHRACNDVAFACFITECSVMDINEEALGNLLCQVDQLESKSVKNITFSFDKTPCDFENKKEYHKARRAYYAAAYKKLCAEFTQHLQKIVDELNKHLAVQAKA